MRPSLRHGGWSVLALAACAAPPPPPPPPPDAAPGPNCTPTRMCVVYGPDDTHATLSANALSAPTQVALERAPSGAQPALPTDVVQRSEVFVLTPLDLAFAQPAEIRIAVAGQPIANAMIYTVGSSGAWERVGNEYTLNARWFAARIARSGYFFAASAP